MDMKNNLTIRRTLLPTAAIMAFLALVAVPISVEAATTTTTVSSSIGSTISLLSSAGTVSIDATPSASGVQTTASDTVTVSTNNTSGYTLQIAETGASTALVSGGNSIPATPGTQTTPAALTANTWGYRVDGTGGFGATTTTAISNAPIGSITYAAVPVTASPNTIKTTASTASNDTTTVWYSVAVNTSTPSGTYTNSVTYTATAN